MLCGCWDVLGVVVLFWVVSRAFRMLSSCSGWLLM